MKKTNQTIFDKIRFWWECYKLDREWLNSPFYNSLQYPPSYHLRYTQDELKEMRRREIEQLNKILNNLEGESND